MMSKARNFFRAARWQHCVIPALMFAALLCSTGRAHAATASVRISSAENPVAAGKGVFLTASVTGGDVLRPLPSGTVTFWDTNLATPLCTLSFAQAIGGDTAIVMCKFSAARPSGMYTLYAQYNGDSIYSGARSANFVQAVTPSYTVNAVSNGGGAIDPAQYTFVARGNSVPFQVSPNAGFRVVSVVGDNCSGVLAPINIGGNIYRFTSDEIQFNCTLRASFSNTFQVTMVADTGGSISPNGTQNINSGAATTVTAMIEFLHPALNYYFVTSRIGEIALLDRTPPFVRTGQSFLVYPSALAGTHPVTRFYFDKVAVGGLRGSHFYTLVDAELIALIDLNPGNVAAPKLPFSEGVDSFAFLPLVEGVGASCAASLVPVLRLFRGNARFPDDV